MVALEGVPSDIVELVGPLLLGYLFNYGLFGILTLQVYIYYLSFPRDSNYIKSLVYFLFFVDTIQTALTTHNAWHFLAKGWGDPGVLADPGWSWIAVPLFSGIVSGTVQLFFSWRIWKLSNLWPLAGFIACIALAQAISAMICGIWFAILNDITKISSLEAPATVWLAGSAVTDVLITACLVTFLSRASTGFSATDNIISKLIRMTVETGAVTASAATLELILFLHFKTNNLHMLPAIPLGKLYTNTLVATLNARSETFSSSQRSRSNTMDPEVGWGTAAKSRGARDDRTSKSHVQITTVREVVRDDVAMVNLQSSRRNQPEEDRAESSSIEDDEKNYTFSSVHPMSSNNKVNDFER